MAELLTEYLQTEAQKSFAYADHDCATFCIRWIDLVRGTSSVSEWLSRYSNEVECIDMVTRLGGMTAIADLFLAGTHEIGRAVSRETGNIALLQVRNVHAFGIRIAENSFAALTKSGLLVTRLAKPAVEWGPVCLR